MRFNSLLLVAVLFVCLHTLSTRSLSTSMGRVRSSKGNARANPIEVETITEERTLDLPSFDQSIQMVRSMASKVAENMSYGIVRERVRNGIEALKFLELNVHLTVWIRYLQWFPEMTVGVTLDMLTYHGDKIVVTMIDALKEANVRNEIQENIKDVLIMSWGDQYKSSLDVLKLLKLDVIASSYSPSELERLEMWIKFMERFYKVSIAQECQSYELDLRLRILDGLRQLADTKNVESMEAVLVQYLCNYKIWYDISLSYAFKALKLDDDLKNLLSHQNREIFYAFAAKAFDEKSKEEALITASRVSYDDKALGKMLFDAVKKKKAEAKPLLKELFRQWNHDTQKGIIIIDDVAQNKVKKMYNVYVNKLKQK